eukprot:352861-Chlamydomonas_euryale.AAC.13
MIRATIDGVAAGAQMAALHSGALCTDPSHGMKLWSQQRDQSDRVANRAFKNQFVTTVYTSTAVPAVLFAALHMWGMHGRFRVMGSHLSPHGCHMYMQWAFSTAKVANPCSGHGGLIGMLISHTMWKPATLPCIIMSSPL